MVMLLLLLLLMVLVLQAKAFADFLSQVVRWTPESRATAADLLRHPWLQENDDDESE
jgi:hypothetical protein